MMPQGVIQWEVLGWRFEVAVYEHLTGSLGERVWAVAGSALELWVDEDVGVPPSCHLVTIVVSTVSAQEVLAALSSFSPTFP